MPRPLLSSLPRIGSLPLWLCASLLFLSGCLSAGDNCPESSNFPNCVGEIAKNSTQTAPQDLSYAQSLSLQQGRLRLTRVSSKESTRQHLRHHYSRRQAWNSDESMLDLSNAIIDAETLEVLLDNPDISTERVWSNLHPDILIGIRYNPKPIELARFNVRTKNYKVLHEFTDYDRCTLGQGEGNQSNDDQFIVVTCTKSDKTTDIIAFDLNKNRILGSIEAQSNLNWASVTPSGSYIVVENNSANDLNSELIRYDIDLSNRVFLMKHPAHGDLSLDDFGNDVHTMITSKHIYYIRIKDRAKVQLPIENRSIKFGSGHISCRNLGRPGWCYLSAHASGHIGAIKIGGFDDASSELRGLDAQIRRGPKAWEHWGYHNSSSKNYRAQAKASVSPTGKKIIFSSDWNGADVNEYVITLDQNPSENHGSTEH